MAKDKSLTEADKTFIESHYLEKNDEELAKAIDVSIEEIRKYRLDNKLLKHSVETSKREGKNPEEIRFNEIRKKFLKSRRADGVKRTLSKEDFDYFANLWADYQLQFEDLTPTEEDMVELLILTKIRINDNTNNLKKIKESEKQIQEQLGNRQQEELNLENEQDRYYYEMIMANNRLAQDANKDYKELVEKFEKIQRALAGTREQREAKHQIGADTFLSLVKQMNDRDIRLEAGRYNELMRLATQKQKAKYAKEHELLDGTTSNLLLSGNEEYMKDAKEEKPGQ